MKLVNLKALALKIERSIEISLELYCLFELAKPWHHFGLESAFDCQTLNLTHKSSLTRFASKINLWLKFNYKTQLKKFIFEELKWLWLLCLVSNACP